VGHESCQISAVYSGSRNGSRKKVVRGKVKQWAALYDQRRVLTRWPVLPGISDGIIKLVSISSTKRDFHIIEEYTPTRSLEIRRQFQLVN
jgi:hypothetical protein